jgi:RNA polymerase sigma factor (sigma-70 family)
MTETTTAAVLEQDLVGLDTAQLVHRAAAGDPRAWEALVDQFGRLIWSVTGRFKLVDIDAADIAQTTWLRLFEHIDSLKYPDRVASWLAAAARNECLRHLAAHKNIVLGHDEGDLTSIIACGPEIDEHLLADERAQVVREALMRLPDAINGCSRCSWPILRLPTPIYPTSSDFPSAA